MTLENKKDKMSESNQNEIKKRVVKIATPLENGETSSVIFYTGGCVCTPQEIEFRKSYQLLAKNIEILQAEYEKLRKKEEPPPQPKSIVKKEIFKPSTELVTLKNRVTELKDQFEENKKILEDDEIRRKAQNTKKEVKVAPTTSLEIAAAKKEKVELILMPKSKNKGKFFQAAVSLSDADKFQLQEKIKRKQLKYEALYKLEFSDFEAIKKAATKIMPKTQVIKPYVPSTQLTELRNKIEISKVQLAPKKRNMFESKCRCWANEVYSMWDEEEILYSKESKHYYHTIDGVIYYLSNKAKGYYTRDSDGNKTYKGLGFGIFYRSPLYEKLYPCAWHGGLVPYQKEELKRKIIKERINVKENRGKDPSKMIDVFDENKGPFVPKNHVFEYADPHHEIAYFETEGGEKTQKVKMVPVSGDPPIYGVYAFITSSSQKITKDEKGDDISVSYSDLDVVCYDNCKEMSMDKVVKENGRNDTKVTELREFNRNVEPAYKEVLASYSVFNRYLENLKENQTRVNELIKKTTGFDEGTRNKVVKDAELVMNKMKEELQECNDKAEESWKRKVAKIKEQNLARERANGSSGKGVSLTFDDLLKLPFPKDDAPDIEKMLYNATMVYLDYIDDVKEGSEEFNQAEQNRLTLNILDLDKIVSGEKIIAVPSDFDEILSRGPPSKDDSRAEKDLYKLIVQYQNEKDPDILAQLRPQIIKLDEEIEEDLILDKEFQDKLKMVLVSKTNENDISDTGKLRYISSLCQDKKKLFQKSEKDYNFKKKEFENDRANLIQNKEELANLTLQIRQSSNGLFVAVKKAHFIGRWFVERAEKFSVISSLKGFSLEDEKVAHGETLEEEKYRLIYEKQQLDIVVEGISTKCKTVRRNLTTTQRMISNNTFWIAQIEEDYKIWRSDQDRSSKSSKTNKEESKVIVVKKNVATFKPFVKAEIKSSAPTRIQPVFSSKVVPLANKPPLAPRSQISISSRPITSPTTLTSSAIEVPVTSVIEPQSINTAPTKMQILYRQSVMKERAQNIPSIAMIEKKMSPVTKSPTIYIPLRISSSVINHTPGSPQKRAASPSRSTTIAKGVNPISITIPTSSRSSSALSPISSPTEIRGIRSLVRYVVPAAPDSPAPLYIPPIPFELKTASEYRKLSELKKSLENPVVRYIGPRFSEPIKPQPLSYDYSN